MRIDRNQKGRLIITAVNDISLALTKADERFGKWRDYKFVPDHMHIDNSRNYSLMIPSEAQAKRNLEAAVQIGECTWAHLLTEEVAEAIEAKTPQQRYEELIQVAAVALNAAIHIKMASARNFK